MVPGHAGSAWIDQQGTADDGLKHMRAAALLLGIVAAGCGAAQPVPRPPHNPPVAGTRTPAVPAPRKPAPVPLIVLVHFPARGWPTFVAVYRYRGGYALAATRKSSPWCPRSWRREVPARDVEALEDALGVLAAARGDAKLCAVSGRRDGASWGVRTRVGDHMLWGTQEVDGRKDIASCRRFEQAARRLMSLAGLSCRDDVCLRDDELRSGRVTPCRR